MQRALLAATTFAGLALGAGCYNPTFDNPTCPSGECPSGYTCVQGQCVTNGGEIDATDAPTDEDATDAPIDAIDAPPGTTTHTATLSVLENQIYFPAGTLLGQGVVITPTFLPTAGNAPVIDTNPGSPFGCKVYEQTTAADIAAVNGTNEGPVSVTVTNPGNPPSPVNPLFPPCTFITGSNAYACVDTGNTGTFTQTNFGNLQMAQTSVYSLNMPQQTFGPEDVGRQIAFSGTGNSGIDGRSFAIVSRPSAQTIAIAVPGPALTTLGSIIQGTYTVTAGSAITPNLPDPGQLGDSASVTVSVDGGNGGGNDFGDFNATVPNVGDDFDMDGPNFMRLLNIPSDGTAFSLGCAPCNGAATTTSVLTLITTDAILTGTDFFVMPRAVNKRVQITCAEIGTGTINVPANVAMSLATSNSTRIQAVFIRGEVALPTTAAGTTATVIAGHSMMGFTTTPR